MTFFSSLAAQFNEPSLVEALKNRAAGAAVGDSGATPTDPAAVLEARSAANVAKRLAAGPGAEAAESAMAAASRGYRPGVSPEYNLPQMLIPEAPAPAAGDPAQHPAVRKRLD